MASPLTTPTKATDVDGRRYVEIVPYPDGPIKDIFREDKTAYQACVICGVQIVHGVTRYYQRNDPISRQPALFDVTFAAVCGPCGDRALEDV